MKKINIKGTDYVPVSERIKEFRSKYPELQLVSEIVSLTETEVIFKASVIKDGVAVAVGHAMEVKGSTFINKTSHIENAETSAWGRALACFGILDESVASYEEVANAKLNNNKNEPVKVEVSSIPADVLAKVSLKLESCNNLDDLKLVYKECQDELKKYPALKGTFTSKKMQVSNG
jgi:hypothetical protein